MRCHSTVCESAFKCPVQVSIDLTVVSIMLHVYVYPFIVQLQ